MFANGTELTHIASSSVTCSDTLVTVLSEVDVSGKFCFHAAALPRSLLVAAAPGPSAPLGRQRLTVRSDVRSLPFGRPETVSATEHLIRQLRRADSFSRSSDGTRGTCRDELNERRMNGEE